MASRAVEQLASRLSTAHIRRGVAEPTAPSSWTRSGLSGRLIELTGDARLTMATSLLLDAQQEGEIAAWVMREESSFFPPDLDGWGVDLDALVVLRLPDGPAVARAADRLARSGAFGLLVLDLGGDSRVPTPLLSRLLGLARRHDIAVLFLTDRGSLGSLISLRVESSLHHPGEDRFVAEVRAVKDKRRAPGWSIQEDCCGAPGLR